jgi:RHS repeat-associated protein
MTLRSRYIFAFAILVAGSTLMNGQALPVPNPGPDPVKSTNDQGVYQVQLSTGGLTGTIPVASYPQLGKLPPIEYFATINNPSYSFHVVCDPYNDTCYDYYDIDPGAGVSLTPNSGPSAIGLNEYIVNGSDISYVIMDYALTDPSGHVHSLLPDSTNSLVLKATDGTGYEVTYPSGSQLYGEYGPWFPAGVGYQSGVITDASGVSYGGAFVARDQNGNSVGISGSGEEIVDSVGRSLPAIPDPGVQWNEGRLDLSTTSCPDLRHSEQPAVGRFMTTIPGINGPQQLLICYATIPYHLGFVAPVAPNNLYAESTSFPAASVQGTGLLNTTGTFLTIQSIVLPDGTYWGFVYDASIQLGMNPGWDALLTEAYGTIKEIIYPKGGFASFDYNCNVSANAYACNAYSHVDFSNTIYQRVASATRNDSNGGIATTNYSYTWSDTTDVTDPAGNMTHYTFSALDGGNPASLYEVRRDSYQGAATGTPVKTVQTSYQYNVRSADSYGLVTPGLDDVEPSLIYTSLNGVLQSAVEYGYPILWTEGPGSWGIASNSAVRSQTPISQTVFDGTNGVIQQVTTIPEFQLNSAYLAQNIVDIPGQQTFFDGNGTAAARTTYGYDPAGNLTSVGRWLNTNGQTLTSTISNNSQGMPVLSTDANGNKTNISQYQCSGLYPQVVTAAFQSTTTMPETTTTTVDCNSGAPLTRIDPNGVLTQYGYDSIGRPTLTQQAVGTPGETWTSITYPSLTQTVVSQDELTKGDGMLVSSSTTDGFGRTIHTTDTANAVVDTVYNSSGQIYSVSNPHLQSASPDGVTRFDSYDVLGRPLVETDPDGVSQHHWTYTGNSYSHSDEAGNTWQYALDGLDRLTVATEPTGYQTYYSYDALGNLSQVNQVGAPGDVPRNRSFTYDSLSRLIQSNNPETGITCYGTWSGSACVNGYDANGNLVNKTDARGITTSYSYDSLGRQTAEMAPGISNVYHYDLTSQDAGWAGNPLDTAGQGNAVGRLVWATNSVNADIHYSYDFMGRVVQQQGCTPHACYVGANLITAQHDLAGNVTDLIYPDGHHLQQAWDSAGRLCNVADNTGGVITCATNASNRYFSSPTYATSGALTGAVYGNGLIESASYNNRQQPTEISVQNSVGEMYMDKQYCYGPATALCPTPNPTPNNGNILNVLNALNPSRSQGYSYDNLNRLVGFANGSMGMSQAFTIDHFGNMTVNSGTLMSTLTFDANNRIDVNTNSGYSYDPAGNLILAPGAISGTQRYNYDASSRLVSIGDPASPSASYAYDPMGTRAGKMTSAGSWTDYVGFGGTPIAEMNSSTGWSDYIYANGERIARIDPTTNLVPYSQQFGNSSWTGYCGPSTNTQQVTAPDGTSTATQINVPGTIACGSQPSWGFLTTIPSGLQVGQTYAVSVWLRGANGGESIAFGLNDCAMVGVQLTISWQRYTQIFPSVSSSVTGCESGYGMRGFQVLDNQPNQTYSVWGAQTEQAASAGPYVATGSSTQTLHYYSPDHLGTTTLVTDAVGNVQNDSDYYPYGTEVSIATADSNHYKFTGLEQDAESGLDHAQFRQLSPAFGRWMSPDPSGGARADPENPQSLNLYAYVLNNPIGLLDPTGLSTINPLVCTAGKGPPVPDTAGTDSLTADDRTHCYVDTSINVTADLSFVPFDANTYRFLTLSTLSLVPTPHYVSPQIRSAPNKPSHTGCKAWAVAKGAFHMGLDIAGMIPFVGAPVSVVNALTTETAAAAQFGTSLATTDYSDGRGVALTYAGAGVALAAKSAVAGSKLSEAIPFVGIVVGVGTTVYDGYTAHKEYRECEAGG